MNAEASPARAPVAIGGVGGSGTRLIAAILRRLDYYMGDDLNDLPALTRAGLSACPADAAPEVRAAVHYVAAAPGGRGAARELVELVLKATGRWERALEHARQ